MSSPAEPDLERRALGRTAGSAVGLRALGTLLGYGSTLVLARYLDPHGFGAVAWVLAVLTILQFVAVLGLDRVVLREVAAARVADSWAVMNGVVRRAVQIVLGVALSFGVVVLVAVAVRRGGLPAPDRAVVAALAVLPLLALFPLRQSLLQAFGRVTASLIPDLLVRPGLFLALLLALHAVRGGVSVVSAVVSYAFAVGAAFVVLELLARRAVPAAARSERPVFTTRVWIAAVPSLLAIGIWSIAFGQVDVVLVGALRSSAETGVYSAASRTAALIMIVAVAVNTALAPHLAARHAAGDRDGLQRILTRGSRITFALAALAALVLVLGATHVLGVFGDGFTSGATTLRLLCLAQIVNVAAGPGLLVLIMTSREREALLGIGAGAVCVVALDVALIPHWGGNGAAISSVVSMAVMNLLISNRVFGRLRLDPTPLGLRLHAAS